MYDARTPDSHPVATDDAPPDSAETRALPGDDLIQDARKQITRDIIIDATPEAIWPCLLQMVRESEGRHAVLRSEAARSLVLGALYDHDARRYLPFEGPRPANYWHATWALMLTPLDEKRTRLHVRSRVAFTHEAVKWAAVWMHPFNDFMGGEELGHLKRAAEKSGAGAPGPA
jgi:hypothetical protein